MASHSALATIVPLLILLWLCIYFLLAVYRAYFGPLSRYPGPKLNALTRLVWARHRLSGNEHYYVRELHHQYGDVVRVSPTELSYATGQAWKDIYCQYSTTTVDGRHSQFQKDGSFYKLSIPGFAELLWSSDSDHARMRRNFSNAFSDKALRRQESTIHTYTNQFVDFLGRHADTAREVDWAKVLNYVTFDIMADLSSGESLGCLDKEQSHPWVDKVFDLFRVLPVFQEIRHYPWFARLIEATTSKKDMEDRLMHWKYSVEMMDRKMARTDDKPDIWGIALKGKEEHRLSMPEIYGNARLFMSAGTETTASLLSGLMYYLLQNPTKLSILAHEIRSTFTSPDQITLDGLAKSRYLLATLDEGLRLYPPIPSFLPRVVPKGGAQICDRFVPENTIVFTHQYAMYRSQHNFKSPDDFVPERWMGDAEYIGDDRSCVQPFSVGPRNCIGKNLANLEMRIILAKVIWHFDMKLGVGTEHWLNQKTFLGWQRPPLPIIFTRVRRDKADAPWSALRGGGRIT